MDAFKNVFSYAFKHKKYIYLAIFLVVIETTFELFIPYLMSLLIDNGVKANNVNFIYLSGGLIFACALLSLITGGLFARYSSKASVMFGKEIREAQFKKIESFSFGNIDKFETSSLVTRVINDSSLMQNTLTSTIRPLFRAPIMLILGIVLSFTINWELALVFICLTPILALCMILILKAAAPKFSFLQKALDNLNLVIQESLIAIRIIKAFVREPYQEIRFDKVNKEYTDIVKKTFSIVNLAVPFTTITMYIATILIMLFGGNLLLNGSIKEGSLTGVFSYVMQTFNSLAMLTNVCLALARSLASCYRVNQILVEEPLIKDGLDSTKRISKGEIEFKNVSFKYFENASEDVLKDISFKLEANHILGIVGSTGSGKSTLVELILRLYDIYKGEILIDEENIKNYSLYNLREDIGIVLQKNQLFSGSLKDNLLWGNKNATDKEIEWAIKTSCVDEFMDRLENGLDTQLGSNGANVSGGQKQRICIARALLKHPKILILDDATSALDTATEKRLTENLAAIKGMTIIIISQRILSLSHADTIMVLDSGNLNGYGSQKEMLETNLIYQNYYNLQTKGDKDNG